MKILVVDVGGTNVKILATGQTEVRKIPSGPELTPQFMIDSVLAAASDWDYDVVAVGYPGPVISDRPLLDPRNLAPGWVGYDFAAHFQRPVKVINDAALQALGNYQGGRMLFLGLGTGLGSTLIIDKLIAPLELAHLPYKKSRTFEDYVGLRGLERLGRRKWNRAVIDVAARLKAAMVADDLVIGGGNAKKLVEIPPGARLSDNSRAFVGGYRLWQGY
jgi:polyphosphate glucokinase